MTRPGPLGLGENLPTVDAGTTARTENKPPGPSGVHEGLTGNPVPTPLLIIHLDLHELIEVDDPREGRISDPSTGRKMPVLFKGDVINKDTNRPNVILTIVRDKFNALKDLVEIELGTEENSDRFLKAHFGFPLAQKGGSQITNRIYGPLFDPAYVGAGAVAQSRLVLESFRPIKGDPEKGVTAYVFEGAVGQVILDLFPNRPVNISNIFANAIAHELGHNLGLKHSSSPSDMMFIYANRSADEQRHWMEMAEKNALVFSSEQLEGMRSLLLSTRNEKP